MGDFEEIYAKYAATVFRYALRCVGRRDVAGDVTAEVFLALHREFDRIDLKRLPGWLFAIAKKRAVDYWRRADVMERYAGSIPTAGRAWNPSVQFWLYELKAIKPVHRACLILRYVHGKERREIAERLGLTEMKVNGHLQYALPIVRREFEQTSLFPSEVDDPAFDLFGLRADGAPPCPAPELVSACRAGTLVASLHDPVSAHLDDCVVCRALGEALADDELTGPTEMESTRILRRVQQGTATVHHARPLPLRSLATATALVTVAVGAAWWAQRGRDVRDETVSRSAPVERSVPARASSAFELGPLPVLQSSTAKNVPAELPPALEPYRKHDLVPASRAFETVVKQHPESGAGQFYLGVTELHRGRTDRAAPALRSAEQLADRDSELARSALWYLALTARQEGNRRDASTRLAFLCAHPGLYSAQACAAERELDQIDALQGIVTDVNGTPLRGAIVSEFRLRFDDATAVLVRTPFAGATEVDGRYRISGAPISTLPGLMVRACKAGYFTAAASVLHSSDMRADFRLYPWVRIPLGTLRDTTKEDPICEGVGVPCRRFALTAPTAGTLDVAVTVANREGMDVWVETPTGDLYSPHLGAPLRLAVPAVAGGTYQIRVSSQREPREFALVTRVR